jgi:hypothetical protein
MRPVNKNTIFYSPDTPPFRSEELHSYLERELQKVKVAIDLLALGHLDKIYILPERPRDGDIRFFAENITPGGSSEGFYGYYDGTWKKLG